MIWPIGHDSTSTARDRQSRTKDAVAKELALIILTLSSPILLVTFFFDGELAQVVFCFLVMTFPLALMVLGASRNGQIGSLKWALAVLWIVLETSVLSILALGLSGRDLWIGAVPLATAVMLCGIWLTPLVLVALAYAWTFSRSGLSPKELEKVRRFRPLDTR